MRIQARESTVSPFWPSRSASCLSSKRPVLILEAPCAYSGSARLLFRRPLPNLDFRRPSVGSFQPLVSFLRLCLSFASFSSQLAASFPACLLLFCMVRFYRTPAVTPSIPALPPSPCHPRHPLHPRLPSIPSIPVFPPSPLPISSPFRLYFSLSPLFSSRANILYNV